MLRQRLPSVLLALLLSLAGGVVAHSQTATALRAGSTLNETIKKGEARNFTFEMGDNQCAELIFEWQGIDLRVAVYDSSDKPMLPAPVQVTSPGPVSVLLKLEKSQSYKIQVTTPVTQNISGSYQVLLKTIPTASSTEESRIQAQNLILAARSSNSISDQVEKYQQALLQVRNASDVDVEAQIFLLLGSAYRNTRDPKLADQKIKLAEENYNNALTLWKQSRYTRGEAYANVSLGHLYRPLRPDTAIPFYVEAARLFEQIGDRRGQAEAMYYQAFALMNLGRTREAIEVLPKVLELRRNEDRLGEALALNMLGDAYRSVGEFAKALQTFDEAGEAANTLEYPLLEAGIATNTALVNDDLSQWESAKAAYLNVLSVYERILGAPAPTVCNTPPATENRSACRSAALVLINVGETYNSLGKPAEALVEFKKSLSISEALGEPPTLAESLTHVGYAYYLLGEIPAALTHLEKALQIQREMKNDKGVATVLTYMGMAYIARREPKVALEKYQAALPAMQKIGDKRSLAILLDQLGTNHTLVGNRADAAAAHQQALDLWKQIKDPDGEALTLYHMADAEREAGNLDAAIKYSEAAIRQVESLRTRIGNEQFRVSYLADKKRYYELDIDLQMQLGKLRSDSRAIAAALQSNEKARARALLDALQDTVSRQAKANEGTNKKVAELFKRREDLVNLLGVRAKQRTELLGGNNNASNKLLALDNEIDKLTEKLADIDSQIRAENPRLAELTRPQPATVVEIQQQLDPDTIMLELALGEKRSYAWTVTTQGVQGYELPPRQQIEDVAARLLIALNAQQRYEGDETVSQRKTRLGNVEKEYAAAAAELRRMVLDAVAQQLDHKRLVIVADGNLQLVPFAVLPDPNNSAVNLIENHEIVTLPSASVLALQRRELANRKPAPRSVAVVADPVFDSDDERVSSVKKVKPKQLATIQPLAGQSSSGAKGDTNFQSALRDVGLDPNALHRLYKSSEEAAEIFKVVGEAFPAIGFDASRQIVMSGKLGQYQNVHFATHGIMDLEHPELSGIVLSRFDEKGRPQDGYLRLYEIYSLNLPAELVVLSACQTGSGKQIKGEGLMALTRGFMYAGAARVVATLWKVDDAATAELMGLFYREMFINKKRPAAALRDAQISLSKEKRWSSPYYWAGFVLQGEWR
jgi:CHAT domain-containing protein/tetratricopeptide (TPR) repeat protein